MIVAPDPHHESHSEYGFDGHDWFHRTPSGMGRWQPMKRVRITAERAVVLAEMVHEYWKEDDNE